MIEKRKESELPPTRVTTDMEREIRAIAERERVSVATIQRSAFQFFLDHYNTKRIGGNKKRK